MQKTTHNVIPFLRQIWEQGSGEIAQWLEQGLGDGSVVRTFAILPEDQNSSPSTTSDNSQPFVTPAPGNAMPQTSTGSYTHMHTSMCMCTHTSTLI